MSVRPSTSALMARARRTPQFDAHAVIPGLWVGSCPLTSEVPALVDAGIDAVVDVRGPAEALTRSWPDGVEVHRVCMPVTGSQDMPPVADLQTAACTVTSLMGAGRQVLVHCMSGVERAPTVACAALVVKGWSLREAYARVVAARPVAMPTPGQLNALRALATELG